VHRACHGVCGDEATIGRDAAQAIAEALDDHRPRAPVQAAGPNPG